MTHCCLPVFIAVCQPLPRAQTAATMSLLGLIVSWFNKLVILIFVFSFLASGLILNVVQLALLPLYWISRYTYRILNAKIVYFHWAREFSLT